MAYVGDLVDKYIASKDGNYITIRETVVKVGNEDIRKTAAKNNTKI